MLQLQSLRLTGFKTFASPTLIQFVDGITAVVGANGSGKSNIVDALKWALGEQSLRDLRSRRAEDVIFAGSQARRPASMAEVLLSFGNESGWLPVDASEVEVGRRLYRSAESEYLINRERVRLRDVHDLVREGGLDSSGHTIVGQGMVDAVLSLRGVERRTYIASVAGVAPYEARRSETLNRLRQTHQNIAAAQVVFEEIEPRLRLLRRQANLAENASAARIALTAALEIHYARRWIRVQADMSTESAALTAATEALDLLRTKIDSLEGERLARRQEIERIRTDRQTRRDRFMAAEYAVKRAMDTRASADMALAGQVAELERLEQRLSSMGAAGDAQAAMAEVTARLDQLQARRAELRDTARTQTELLERLQLRKNASMDRKNAAVLALNALRQSHKAAITRRTSLERELDEAKQSLAATRVELPRLSVAIDESRNDRDDLAEHLAMAEQSLENARASQEAIAVRMRQVRDERDAASEVVDSLARSLSLNERRQAELAQSRSQDGPRLLEGAAIPERFAAAVASSMGDLVASARKPTGAEPGVRPATRPSETSRTAVMKALTATRFVPLGWLSDLVELPADHPAAALLAATMVLAAGTDLESAWRAISAVEAGVVDTAPFRLVGLDGRQRRSGQMALASEPARQAVELEVEVQRLADEHASLTERASDASEKLTNLEAQLVDVQAQLDSAGAELQAVSERLVHMRADLAAAEGKVKRTEADAEVCRRRMDEFEGLESGLQSQLDELRASSAGFDQSVERLEHEIETGDKELTDAAAEAVASETQVRELRGEVTIVDREVEIEQAELRRLTVLIQAADRERSELAGLIATGIENRKRLESDRLTAESGVAGAETEVEDARIALAEAPPEPQELISNADGNELRALQAKREEHVAAEQKHRTQLEHLESLAETLLTECRLDLGRDPASLVAPEDAPELTDVEIRRLRVRAEQAADVEPGAPEEYRQLAERRDLLERELTDLRDASEMLETMLRDADREVKRRFARTFSVVNDLFAQFFTEIFGGGSAHLALESVEDIESVEIVAQLPGKRARDLSGLSGGERTLVAGAFLFALISTAPPPFCVLDEVDAALDETNVDRYLGVMRQLANQTQFVVVTHNRGTMAAADTLYGIVLDPNGGSRALSLRLDQAIAG